MSEPFDESVAPESSGDEVINDLMAKRKLQQEALLKIMTSIEKTEEVRNGSGPVDTLWKKAINRVFGAGKKQKLK
jgi:hypothetical protein